MPDEPARRRLADEWFLHGEHDLQSSRILLAQGGHSDTIAVLLQQAAENYLKGYLLTRGWRLRKTHDLELLVSEAAAFDDSFQQFLDFARLLSALYLEERYPPGPPREYSRDEMARLLAQTETLASKGKQAPG